MNEEDYSDIPVIKIYTEKELNAEYDALNTLLIDTNGDWNKRFNAIKRLEGIILGGAFQLDGFPSMMAKLSMHFTAQLNDLRSAVSKEACRLICMAAKISQEKLESLSDKLIHKEGIIKLINSANKVISENGHECIYTLIENVRGSKIIPRLIDELGNKNTALRHKISLYLKLIMEIYPDSIIEKNATGIENAINLAIGDANKDVRQLMRQSFLIYSERFPQRAAKLQAKFDNSVQKALVEESKEFSYTEKPEKIEKPSSKTSLTKESSKQIKENSKRDSLPGENSKSSRESINNKRPSTTKEKEYVSKEIPSQESSNENKFSSKPQTADPKKLFGKPLVETQEIRTNAQELDRKNNHRGAPNEILLPEPEKKRASSILQGQNKKSPPKAPERDKSASKIGYSMSTSAPLAKRENDVNVAKSVNFEKGKFEDKEASSTRPSSTSSGSKRPDSNYASGKELNNKDLSGKKDKPNIPKKEIEQPLMNNFYQSIKEEDLKFLIDKSNDDNWAVRSNSFEKINEFISDLKPNEHLSNNLLEDLIDTHIQHINDFHYKVIISCQESFTKIITIYKQKLLTYMDKIIPPIFLNLTEGKEKVYQSTNFIINLINKIYNGDELFPHFFRSLDFSQKAKYRASVLEFMNIIIRNCKIYFNAPINIRTCIIKFAMLMTEFSNNKNIIMPCLGMILYLRDINFTTAMSAITTLNHGYLSNLRGIASQYATDLEENIRYFNFQVKTMAKERPQSPRKEIDIAKDMQVSSTKSKEESKSFGPVHEMSGLTKKPSSREDVENQVEEEDEEDEDGQQEEEENEDDEGEIGDERENGEIEEEEREDQEDEEEKQEGRIVDEDEEEEEEEHDEEDHGEENQEENEDQDQEEEEEQEEEASPERSNSKTGNQPLTKQGSKPPYNYQKSLSSEKNDEKIDVIKNHDSPYEIEQSKKAGALKKNQIASLKNAEEEIPTLEKLDAVISDYPKKKAFIEKNLDTIICQVLEFFTAKEQSIIEYAMDILRKLLKLPFNFGMQIDQLLSCLISLYYSPFKFSATVDDMVRIVLNLGYADLCMHSMIENLEREDHPVLQILIKNITGMFIKKADPEIVKFLPDLILKYKTLINHQNPDVRKNVVFSLVDLHAAHPSEMQDYISEFSASHQKLIAIYIQKRSEKKAK